MTIINFIPIFVTFTHYVLANREADLINALRKNRSILLGDTKPIPRPVRDSRDPVPVQFSLGLAQVIELEEDKQALHIATWETMVWRDEGLIWNPADYAELTHLVWIDADIWLPDIMPLKILGETQLSYRTFIPYVNYTGDVIGSPQHIYAIACEMDHTLFPLDVHKCDVTYGSWALSDGMIQPSLRQSGYYLDSFVENQKWRIVNVSVSTHREEFSCCPGVTYTTFRYVITVQRQVAFFAVVLLLPAGLLSVLTMVTFWLPPDHSDKLQIGLSIFLSYFVLLLIVVDVSPPVGTKIPYIGQFFSVSLVMIAASVLGGTTAYNIRDKGRLKRKFPKFIKRPLEVISRILCVKGYDLRHIVEENFDDKLWYLFGCVIDRLFLVIYILIMAVTCYVVFNSWFSINLEPFFKPEVDY